MVHVSDQETIAGALITGLVAIAGAIRWSVGRISKSSEKATQVILEFSKTSASLSTKFDGLAAKFDHLAARFDRIVDTLLRDRDRRAVARIARKSDGRRATASDRDDEGAAADRSGRVDRSGKLDRSDGVPKRARRAERGGDDDAEGDDADG